MGNIILNKKNKKQPETIHTNLIKSIIVIGETGAGKSWLLNQLFCGSSGNLIFEESNGIESQTSSLSLPFEKRVELKEDNQTKSFDLCGTDTHGIDNIKEKPSNFVYKITNEIKSKPYTVIIVFKYGRYSQYTKQTLDIIGKCFCNKLKEDSTICVINMRPRQKKNSTIDYDSECEKLFEKISIKLKVKLIHRFILLEDDENLCTKINKLLSDIKNSSPVLH